MDNAAYLNRFLLAERRLHLHERQYLIGVATALAQAVRGEAPESIVLGALAGAVEGACAELNLTLPEPPNARPRAATSLHEHMGDAR